MTQAIKLGIEEFELLSMLGRRARLTNFGAKVFSVIHFDIKFFVFAHTFFFSFNVGDQIVSSIAVVHHTFFNCFFFV